MQDHYFASLVTLPDVIVKPGSYLTRAGETVEISDVSKQHDFGCIGVHESGQDDFWHKSGRLYASRESDNDIVSVKSALDLPSALPPASEVWKRPNHIARVFDAYGGYWEPSERDPLFQYAGRFMEHVRR